MNDKVGLIGSFETAAGAHGAVTALRQAGFTEALVYSPVNSDELQVEPGSSDSWLGFLAFGGAAVGTATGLLLTIHTSTQWPLMTGGQPIVSLPPFFVISFELTILFGVLATMLGLFWGIHRSTMDPKFYDSRFSVDRFGVYVPCRHDRAEVARRLLSIAGAEEVRDERF
ncbi:MAG TPA: DUF3341 domain-containing protein [Candidatus Udaeobacter sp.]|jgi:molybdopterin-containing oxidoreductase family membrane subunit|nr:DUF3341 domain-containing protein [Candidatus Udaeobacter sp.]